MESSTQNKNRWYVLLIMCMVLFIISIDNTVLNLALPSISTDLGASASQLQWIVDAYTLIFASLLITTGSVGDRYGRKKLLMLGLALFGLGSLGAALSVSTFMLIVFRGVLGLAGSMVMPSTLSILTNVFQDGKERAKAIAIWSSIFSIGAGIGPIIGGFLINSFSWSAVFYLNIPIVAIALLGGFLIVPESKDSKAPRPDLPGVGLSIIGVFSLVFGTIQAGENGWFAAPVLISFVIAAVFIYAFIRWENHSSTPMLPLYFFKNKNFTGANVSLTISSFAMMGSMYFFSQFLQSVLGYTPIIAAVSMFPMTISVLFFTMQSVKLDSRMGTKFSMSLGLLLSGAALFLFSLTADINTSYWYVLLVQIILGSGIGFTMSPATNAIMSSLPPNRAGVGSAMNDTTRQMGGALGIAVLGALMNGSYRAALVSFSGTQGVTEVVLEQIRSSIQGAHLVAANFGTELANQIVLASNQAFVGGMREALLVGGIFMVIASITAWLTLPSKNAASSEASISG